MNILDTFKDFLADEVEKDMFISGRAGTGKTTEVSALALYCDINDIECTVSAYTHKAVGVLAMKMPSGITMSTLHSFLGKRPTINEHALKADQVETNTKQAETKKASVLFIDEYSMIGEKDFLDIRDAQDDQNLKVVWIGDPYQLPPVKDIQVVDPRGDYQILLTKIRRQAEGNPLGEILEQLVSFIEGEELKPLKQNSNFLRECNIIQDYVSCDVRDKVILAYTNKRVQEINAAIQGYMEPQEGDILWSPTTQKEYEFIGKNENPKEITPAFGDTLALGSKYKTLEHLIYKGVEFCDLAPLDDEQDNITVAYLFGHETHKQHLFELKQKAAEVNREIQAKHQSQSTT